MLKARAQVKTDKVPRHLKTLCDHFSHKVQATYDYNYGGMQFGIGSCEMQASDDTLAFDIQADDVVGVE